MKRNSDMWKLIMSCAKLVGLIAILFLAIHKPSCTKCEIFGTPVAIIYTSECPTCGGVVEGDYTLVTPSLVYEGDMIGYEYCTTEGCEYRQELIINKREGGK